MIYRYCTITITSSIDLMLFQESKNFLLITDQEFRTL